MSSTLLLTTIQDMARASDVFIDGDADSKIHEVKSWLKSKGVRDFESVSFVADQLTKVNEFPAP
jgi:hypothetical protein